MAQRISRAKRALAGAAARPAGRPRTVLRVLYLVFNEGYGGDVDLAAEAIRLTRQLASLTDEPEVARPARADAAAPRPARLPHPAERRAGAARRPGPRPLGHRRSSPRASAVLQAALARDRLGEYQAQAAIAALHADARVARGDGLGPDPRVVRRARPAHRQPGRAPQPRRRGRARPTGPRRPDVHSPSWTGRPAPVHRGGGVPAREGGRPDDRRRPLRRGVAIGRERGRAEHLLRQAARLNRLTTRPG